MTIVLALDPARSTGWAQLCADGSVDSGTKALGPKDMRIGPLLHNLTVFLVQRIGCGVHHIYYELPWVGPHTKQAATLMLFGLAAQIEVTCFRHKVMPHPTRNGAFISHFTGGAPRAREPRKAATIAECRSRGFDPIDDDEADAIALLDYAIHDLHLDADMFPAGPLFVGER